LAEDNNLACITVFPPFQRKGYGKFMIAFSYFLSGEIDDRSCTPERPLSKMGALSYLSFWKETIFGVLRSKKELKKANYDVTIREISEATNLQIDDVILTLQSLNLVKYWKGTFLA
jgi:hypothetical protein